MPWLWIGLGRHLGQFCAGGCRLNSVHPWLPYGTLFANVLGRAVDGICFDTSPKVAPKLTTVYHHRVLGTDNV